VPDHQRQHSNCQAGKAELLIQQFTNSPINYFFFASTEMKRAQW